MKVGVFLCQEREEHLPLNLNYRWSDYLKIKENIEEYFTKCASEIKNRGNPQVASPTYNKQSFKEDMNKVSKLSKDEIRKYEKTIKEDRKDIEVNLKLPVINGCHY
ncbi:hypothetical protein [Salinicoccus roseus]|uniref:hypothetical protein n=1 Tax=Salinicoccus roseus TaxID=45670 RepID=UPI0035666720